MTERLIETKAALRISGEGEITGLAWKFNEADRVGDVIVKGAFAGAKAPLPILAAHDQKDVVGVWDEIVETDEGLQVKGRLLVEDVTRAREVRALVRERAVTGLSIGFQTKKATARSGGGRTITELALHEISLVAVPCHPAAQVQTMKAAGDAATINDKDSQMENEAVAAPAVIDTKALDKVVDRLDKLEAKLNRPVAANNNHPSADNGNLEAKAFESFARRGIERMESDEVKSLNVSTDTAGGYLAPEGFMHEIDKTLVLYSPVRQVARVASASVGELLLPKRTGTLTGKWVGEEETRSGTQPAYGQQKFVMHEIACYVDVSNRLLEDSAFNIEGELAHDFGEEFGRLESAAFIAGDGDDKPSGILLDTGIETLEAATAAAFTADLLIDLFHALPSFYAANGTWAMNRATMGKIRKMKDSQGHYLWQDSIAAGNPATILGRPVIEFPDMPDVDAENIPLLFGDFAKAFRIFDRTAISVLRDPYSVQTNGQTRFHARKRVGAAVSKAEALKSISIAA